MKKEKENKKTEARPSEAGLKENKKTEARPSESGLNKTRQNLHPSVAVGSVAKLKEKEIKEEKKSVRETEKKEENIKEEKKEEKPVKEKPKKTEAVVNAYNLPISTKHSAAICSFIKNKKIENAIAELGQVLILKKAVPMKGEIPHRKGKRIMSGRFPKKATQNFITLLKNLSANATYNGLENPVIVETIANIGSRPYGRFGLVRKKRTHVRLKAMELKENKTET